MGSCNLSNCRGASCIEREESKVQVKKRTVVPDLVQSVTEQISAAVAEGFLLVYTDRSSKHTKSRKLLRVGGLGVYAPPLSRCGFRIPEPLDGEEC